MPFQYNKDTDSYEALVRIRVPSELFRRILLIELEQSPYADLTKPETWTQAIERVSPLTRWLNNPHVEITSLEQAHVNTHPPSPVVKEKPVHPRRSSSYTDIESRLREAAKSVPPYLWMEQVRTPTYAGSWDTAKYRLITDSREYKNVSYIRSDEKKILMLLKREWEQGTYHLTEEASRLQSEHERAEQASVTTKITAVAQAVNGSRHL